MQHAAINQSLQKKSWSKQFGMFVTLVAHSYFKLFVTAFIEIHGDGETARAHLFGKPPMKIITPIVNVVALIECIFWVIFSLFVLINVATSAFHVFIVFVPLYLMFVFFLVSMVMVYILFTISMVCHLKLRHGYQKTNYFFQNLVPLCQVCHMGHRIHCRSSHWFRQCSSLLRYTTHFWSHFTFASNWCDSRKKKLGSSTLFMFGIVWRLFERFR